MKNSLVLTLLLTFLLSCTDDLSLAPDAQNRNLNANATASITPVPTGDYVWTLMPRYNDADGLRCYSSPQSGQEVHVIDINGDIYGFVGGPYSSQTRKLNKTTKQWETYSQTVASSMQTALLRTNYMFSYGNKMYSGLWHMGNDDHYEGIVYTVNQVTGTLAQAAPFPGVGTVGFSAFVIGNKGYVMGGFATNNLAVSSQFYEYNFDTNVWTNKGTMPGGPRANGTVFVIGNDVYYGLGTTAFANGPIHSTEWIKFDPSNPKSVTSLQSFPGIKRDEAKGFVLNNKVYLGWGFGEIVNGVIQNTNDLWEFNPSTNVWKQKAKCPTGVEMKYYNQDTFVQGNAGYLVIGCLSSLWRYSATSAVPVPPPGTGPVPVPTNP